MPDAGDPGVPGSGDAAAPGRAAPVASGRIDKPLLAITLPVAALRNTSYIQPKRCFSPSCLPPARITHPAPGTRSSQHRPRQPAETPGSSPARHLPEGSLSSGPSRSSGVEHQPGQPEGSPGSSPARPRTPRCPGSAARSRSPGRRLARGAAAEGRSSVRGRGNHPRGSGERTRRSGCEEDAPHRLLHVAAQRPKWLWNSPPTPPPPQSLGRKHGVTASASFPAPRSILPWFAPVPDPSAHGERRAGAARARCPLLPPSLRPGQRDAAAGEDRAAFRRQSLRSARAFSRLTES